MTKLARPSWTDYYMNIAQEVAKRSNCIKRQIGAVLVLENRIIASGYNGTPRGVTNCDEGGCGRCNDGSIESGTQLDKCICSHAEENAIVQCAYHGISTKGSVLYTTMSPCLWCAKMAINSGIEEIIAKEKYPQDSLELLDDASSVKVMIDRP